MQNPFTEQPTRHTLPVTEEQEFKKNDSPSACGAADLYVADIFNGASIGSRLSEGRRAEELRFVPPGYEDLAK